MFCTVLHAQGIPLWEFSLTMCMRKEKGATDEVFTQLMEIKPLISVHVCRAYTPFYRCRSTTWAHPGVLLMIRSRKSDRHARLSHGFFSFTLLLTRFPFSLPYSPPTKVEEGLGLGGLFYLLIYSGGKLTRVLIRSIRSSKFNCLR
jgi:hypothetical protein